MPYLGYTYTKNKEKYSLFICDSNLIVCCVFLFDKSGHTAAVVTLIQMKVATFHLTYLI